MSKKIDSKFKCLYDAVLVKMIKNEESVHGGIIIPDLGKERNIHGEVVAVGPGKFSMNGTLIPTQVKVGDKVILPTMGFTTLEHEGEEYVIGNENQILCIFK